MAIDWVREVEYVARLARLYLTEEEKKRMAADLGEILERARQVQELDTAGVEPTAYVISPPAIFREDRVEPSLPLNRVLQNAPHRDGSYFRVPRIAAEEGQEG